MSRPLRLSAWAVTALVLALVRVWTALAASTDKQLWSWLARRRGDPVSSPDRGQELTAVAADERAQAVRHVDVCAVCGRELDAIAALATELIVLAAPVEPPRSLESAVLARVVLPRDP